MFSIRVAGLFLIYFLFYMSEPPHGRISGISRQQHITFLSFVNLRFISSLRFLTLLRLNPFLEDKPYRRERS